MLAAAPHLDPAAMAAIETPAGGPHVRLLDARGADLDEAGLREWARVLGDAQGAPYVTRSYRHPYALLAWHDARVGVDIERIEPFDAAFAASICTPDERLDWASLPDRDAHLASLWSGKEALAKALGDALSHDPRRLEAPLLWPAGRAGAWHGTQLAVAAGHVAWVCWLTPPRAPASTSILHPRHRFHARGR